MERKYQVAIEPTARCVLSANATTATTMATPGKCAIKFCCEDLGRYIYYVVIVRKSRHDSEDSGIELSSQDQDMKEKKTPPWVPPPARTSRSATKQSCYSSNISKERSKFEQRMECIPAVGAINLDDDSSELSVKLQEIQNEIRNLRKTLSSTEIASQEDAQVGDQEQGPSHTQQERVQFTKGKDEHTVYASYVEHVFSSAVSVTKEVVSRIQELRRFMHKLNPNTETFPSDIRFVEYSKNKLLNVVSELEKRNSELQEVLGNIVVTQEIQDKVEELNSCKEALAHEISLLEKSSHISVHVVEAVIREQEEVDKLQGSQHYQRQSFAGSSSISVRDGNLTSNIANDKHDLDDERAAHIKLLQHNLEAAAVQIEELKLQAKQAAIASELEKEALQQAILVQKSQAISQQHQMEQESTRLNDSIGILKLLNARLKGEKDRLEIENHTLEIRLNEFNVDVENKCIVTSELELASLKLADAATELQSVKDENRNLMDLLQNAKTELQQSRHEMKRTDFENQGFHTVAHEHTVEDSQHAQAPTSNSRLRRSSATFMSDKDTQRTYVSHFELPSRVSSEIRIGDEKLEQIILQHVKSQEDLNLIIHKLQEFEERLERSRAINEELASDIQMKESQLVKIVSKFEAVTKEKFNLQQQLDDATDQLQKYRNEAKSAAFVLEKEMQLKMNELEQFIKSLQHENKVLRKENGEIEKRHSIQIDGIQRRFEEQQIYNRRLQDYIAFLRSSYAVIVDRPVVQGLN